MAITGQQQELRNPDGTFKKGVSGNPNGRPVGSRDYSTIYRDALKTLGEVNNRDPAEIEEDLIRRAIMAARSGNYQFYKDVFDRLYGKATQKQEIQGVHVHIAPDDIRSLINELPENEQPEYLKTLARLAKRVRYLRGVRDDDERGITEAHIQSEADQLPQGKSSRKRSYEMASTDSEYLRSAVEWRSAPSDYQSA